MSLLYDVIVAHRCRSTHHYIAIEALNLLKGKDAEKWRDLFLFHNEALLEGAKAPDTIFKDFQNHVLHVSDNFWGGAPDTAQEWFDKAIAHLKAAEWTEGVYALGVMSHYYADPIQPFHTGQTEEEGAMHRALEWSIAKSRTDIIDRIEAKGYPKVQLTKGSHFVAKAVKEGAKFSHPHYQTFLDHYDLDTGVKDPPAGLDDTLREVIADLVGYATAGLAELYDRAFEIAAVSPPKVNITLKGYVSTLDIPVHWVTSKLEDAADKKTVEAMYEELQKTGKVIKTLPDDDKAVRALHAKEVLKIPLEELNKQPLKPIGTKNGEAPKQQITAEPKKTAPSKAKSTKPAKGTETSKTVKTANKPKRTARAQKAITRTRKDGLSLSANIEKAPSIGPKTAARFEEIGIKTIRAFLKGKPDVLSSKINVRYMTAKVIADWQAQTQLMLDVPTLRTHDAQILVGSGIRTAEELKTAKVSDILKAATGFLETSQGARTIRRDDDRPDEEEVTNWIDTAKAA